MPGVAEAMTQNRQAADLLCAAADGASEVWEVPRARGKWSPSQVVEHVTRALEQSARELRGEPALFPKFPVPLQPVMRGLFFNWILRRGSFPRGTRTNKEMNPERGAATPAEARARVHEALHDLEQTVKTRSAGFGPVHSGAFGAVALSDYLMFQAIHTRHHIPQIESRPR
jgi:Protein of unknown function (DUF1569)